MAVDYEAVGTAIREVVLGQLGAVRRVERARAFGNAVFDELPDESIAPRGLVNVHVDIELGQPMSTTHLGPPNAGRRIQRLPVDFLVTHQPKTQVQHAQRLKVRAAMAADFETIRSALEVSGQLATTRGNVATGIVSGCLREAEPPEELRASWHQRIFQARLHMVALVLDSPPTTTG